MRHDHTIDDWGVFKDCLFKFASNFIDEGVYTLNQSEDTEVSCFKDSLAKKFIGQMDELCGCPCGCSDAKILDDNLPKYI